MTVLTGEEASSYVEGLEYEEQIRPHSITLTYGKIYNIFQVPIVQDKFGRKQYLMRPDKFLFGVNEKIILLESMGRYEVVGMIVPIDLWNFKGTFVHTRFLEWGHVGYPLVTVDFRDACELDAKGHEFCQLVLHKVKELDRKKPLEDKRNKIARVKGQTIIESEGSISNIK